MGKYPVPIRKVDFNINQLGQVLDCLVVEECSDIIGRVVSMNVLMMRLGMVEECSPQKAGLGGSGGAGE